MGQLEELGFNGNSAETALISCNDKTEEVCLCACVCVYVRACVRACVCACVVCVCVCACLHVAMYILVLYIHFSDLLSYH